MIPPTQQEHNRSIDANRCPSPSSGDWTPGALLLDDYRIERILGRGGMGEVALVRSASMQRFYAVKRILPKWMSRSKNRRMFLQELLTWSDLPDHPNLTAFRFCRTVGDELLIFTDYIGGGSLKQWISTNRISSLEPLLHIAIQIAWGLHVAHESGVLHQDIKPDNILMDTDGTPRITDFGLARVMRYRCQTTADSGTEPGDSGDTLPPSSSSAFASCSGGTPGFCSPEQFEKKPLTRAADIWSWGLTVLAMFNFRIQWKLGPMARDILRTCMEQTRDDTSVTAIPPGLAAILDKCFLYRLDDRYGNFAEILTELKSVYQEVSGDVYAESLVDYPAAEPLPTSRFARSTLQGLQWSDPAAFAETGCLCAGISPGLLTRIVPEQLRTRKAAVIGDLILFDEARRLLENAPESIRFHPEKGLIPLLLEKAMVHRFLGDSPGALQQYDDAIALLESTGAAMPESLVYTIYGEKGVTLNEMQRYREADAYLCHVLWEEDHRTESLPDTIRSKKIRLMDIRAKTLRALGDREAAFSLFDRAITDYRELIGDRPDHPMNQHLAGVLMNKANSFPKSGASADSIDLYDRAIALLEHLDSRHSTPSLKADIALVYSNKAAALYTLGQYADAVRHYRSAIAIRKPLLATSMFPELASDLASNYSNLANALWGMGETDSIQELYDESIRIRERLVFLEGRTELSYGLVVSCSNRAFLALMQKDFPAAEQLTRLARRILFHLIDLEPGEELDVMLARVTQMRAETLNLMGDYESAFSTIGDATRIWERLTTGRISQDYRGFLAISLSIKARILADSRQLPEAIEIMRSAIDILEQIRGDGQWHHFTMDLLMARRHLISFLERTGKTAEAVESVSGSIQLIERLRQHGDRPEYATESAILAIQEFLLLNPKPGKGIPDDVRKSADLLHSTNAQFSNPEIGDLMEKLARYS